MIREVANQDDSRRREAAGALGNIGADAAPAVPVLIRLLSDTSQGVRCNAAESLGEIGPAARAAVPALIKALGDRDETVRSFAVSSLGKIRPPSRGAIAALIRALGDSEAIVRCNAAWALRDLGPAAEPAAEALGQALSDKDKSVAEAAAMALAGIGPGAAPAVPQLIDALKLDEPRVEHVVIPFPPASGDLPFRFGVFTSGGPSLPLLATEALGAIGPRANAAVPALVRALHHPDDYVRASAAMALGHIGDPRALKPLAAVITDNNALVSRWASESLKKLRGRDK